MALWRSGVQSPFGPPLLLHANAVSFRCRVGFGGSNEQDVLGASNHQSCPNLNCRSWELGIKKRAEENRKESQSVSFSNGYKGRLGLPFVHRKK